MSNITFMLLIAFIVGSFSVFNYIDHTLNEDVEPAPITYTTDVRPLFKRSCLPCHGPNTGRNWLDYDTAYRKRIYIKFRTLIKKDMPPSYWKKQLSEEERDLIGQWVDAGAKE